jgi:GAF domain-containing protein
MPGHSPAEARFFAQLSQDLMREPGVPTTVERVVERALDVVAPCDWAGISLRRRRNKLETVAATHPLVRRCDDLQYALDEGPCVEAIRHDEFYLSQDLATERRWPAWAPRVVDEGVCSILSIRLSSEKGVLGALNLYSSRPHAWKADDIDVALIFAAHGANAMSSASLASGLRSAMESRHLIGVAQGILMVRYDMNLSQSFEVLRRLSSDHNIKLRELAVAVVEERGVPEALHLDHPRGERVPGI